MVVISVIFALAAELGPEFVGNVKKVLANLDKNLGDKIRADLSADAVRTLTKDISTADKLLGGIKDAAAQQLLGDGASGGSLDGSGSGSGSER